MAEQEDALGSKPGSSKEYEFDSHQGDHQAPDDAEFKELDELAQEARLRGLDEDEADPWHTALDAILWSASYQSSEEELDKALSWALINKTA